MQIDDGHRKIYYAKSPDENGHRETVKEHCEKVAALAGEYAECFGQKQQAEICGRLHDFGKYSKRFGKVLEREETGIDHAICGAALLNYRYNERKRYAPLIEAINAHHTGLVSISEMEIRLKGIFEGTITEGNAGKQSALCGKDEFKEAILAYQEDFPEDPLKKNLLQEPLPCADDPISRMLYTRMLLSCLVDADYTVSGGQADIVIPLNAREMLTRLYAYRNELRKRSRSDVALNKLRDELFEVCGKAAEQEGGLFTLTAPTGTGKTLALLHFALKHCIHTGKRRIILVLPFLSLTEQSTAEYAKFTDTVLEDHSQSHIDDKLREHAAKWDAPIIVTTSVKFFESLFAHRPTDCRKLHNIADSVILFDEAQSLPANLTAATLNAVKALCREYLCTMVFSTATQPNFAAIPDLDWQPREIMKENEVMYRALRRTNVIWRLSQGISLEAIAEEMVTRRNVCAIVNSRAHARKLFESLKMKIDIREGSLFFLTTDLCPAHRSKSIANIKERQKAGLPCIVVSTQCIEAGVDLDFDVLYRSLAPLEAIIQAAGRCNRNGRIPEGGQVIIFEPDEDRLYPDQWYGQCAVKVKEMLFSHEIDLQNPAHIAEYYQRVFEDRKDKPELLAALQEKDYAKADKEYTLIDNQGFQVLVPYVQEGALYERLALEAKENGINARWLKEAAPILINTYARLDHGAYPVENVKYKPYRGKKAEESDVYLLCTGAESCYREDIGLRLEERRADELLGF